MDVPQMVVQVVLITGTVFVALRLSRRRDERMELDREEERSRRLLLEARARSQQRPGSDPAHRMGEASSVAWVPVFDPAVHGDTSGATDGGVES